MCSPLSKAKFREQKGKEKKLPPSLRRAELPPSPQRLRRTGWRTRERLKAETLKEVFSPLSRFGPGKKRAGNLLRYRRIGALCGWTLKERGSFIIQRTPQDRIRSNSRKEAQETQKVFCLCAFCAFSWLFRCPVCRLSHRPVSKPGLVIRCGSWSILCPRIERHLDPLDRIALGIAKPNGPLPVVGFIHDFEHQHVQPRV